jgi:hypothetical protein
MESLLQGIYSTKILFSSTKSPPKHIACIYPTPAHSAITRKWRLLFVDGRNAKARLLKTEYLKNFRQNGWMYLGNYVAK